MLWPRWVLDATQDDETGIHCFCPIDDDGSVVFGMNLLSDRPPDGAACVGVVHLDGQEAADAWCENHQELLFELCETAKG